MTAICGTYILRYLFSSHVKGCCINIAICNMQREGKFLDGVTENNLKMKMSDDELNIEECDSERDTKEGIIPAAALMAAKNRVAGTTRIKQNKISPEQKGRKTTLLGSGGDGPLHKTLHNKTITKDGSTNRRHAKIFPVVDSVEDEDNGNLSLNKEADSLQNNLDITRKSGIKGYFAKEAHKVSNLSTRTSDAEQQRQKKKSKAIRSDESAKDDIPEDNAKRFNASQIQSPGIERVQNQVRMDPRRRKIVIQPLRSPFQTRSRSKTPLEEPAPEKSLSPLRRLGSISLDHDPPNSETGNHQGKIDEEMTSVETGRGCTQSHVGKDPMMNDPYLEAEMDDNDVVAEIEVVKSGESGLAAAEMQTRNMTVEKAKAGSPAERRTNQQQSQDIFDDLEDISVPGHSSTTPSSSKPLTVRSTRRSIDHEVFLQRAEDLQKEALARDYVMQPDLSRPAADGTDTIMFDVSSLSSNLTSPPFPHPRVADPSTRFWGSEDCVDLPWDTEYKTEDDICWGVVIMRELRHAANSGFSKFYDFVVLLKRLRTYHEVPALFNYYKKLDSEEQREEFLFLLHEITKLACKASKLITKPLPILFTTENKLKTSVSLSQEQCAALLACSFFGLFSAYKDFNHLNLGNLMQLPGQLGFQKLKFILNYFARVIDNMPIGVVTFRRVAYKLEDMDIQNSEKYRNALLSNVGMKLIPIEECPRMLQMDFANKYIGGGVLGGGFVQEEIRFLCCPEMMISMLLCPEMRSNEAIFIAGAQQYSSYVGYGSTTKMRYLKEDIDQPRDKFRRIMCEVVAIDAKAYHHNNSHRQFEKAHIDREIRKAFAGFNTTLEEKSPVATGNWGCGAFHGDVHLKCIIQLIAASMCGRDLLYCIFDNNDIVPVFCDLVKRLKERGVLLSQLYEALISFTPKRELPLYDYLVQKCISR